jgi:hypothetical protein
MKHLRQFVWWLRDRGGQLGPISAPTVGGGTTSFMLVREARSRRFRPFPKENFLAATNAFQEGMRVGLRDMGYTL